MDALEAHVVPDIAEALADASDDDIGDDLLRLIFTSCHPVLSTDARVALTLRLLGGLTTGEIARAFLTPEPTIAQRIVRAKRTLAAAHVPFEVPAADARPARLASVLEVIYLVFNEGHAATSGDDWTRPALCDEALRLGRVLAGLAPDESEVLAVALMELQASRMHARTDAQGRPVLLLEDRSRWDPLLIRRGLAALERATKLGGVRGPYALQAALAACHARARRASDTDWAQIVALYDALAEVAPSPVVELNRAVAVGMAFGPAAALELVDAARRSRARALSLAAERARRPAGEAGPRRRGEGRTPRGGTDAQRTRTRITAQARDGRVTHAARANAGPGSRLGSARLGRLGPVSTSRQALSPGLKSLLGMRTRAPRLKSTMRAPRQAHRSPHT